MIEFATEDVFNGKLEKLIVMSVAYAVHVMHNDKPIASEEGGVYISVKTSILYNAYKMLCGCKISGKQSDIVIMHKIIESIFITMRNHITSSKTTFDGIYEKIYNAAGIDDIDDELIDVFKNAFFACTDPWVHDNSFRTLFISGNWNEYPRPVGGVYEEQGYT